MLLEIIEQTYLQYDVVVVVVLQVAVLYNITHDDDIIPQVGGEKVLLVEDLEEGRFILGMEDFLPVVYRLTIVVIDEVVGQH